MKPYDARQLLNVFILCLVLGWIAALVIGCATPRGTKLVRNLCPDTQFVVNTPEDWSEVDQTNLDLARKGCARKYPNSPCLKKFIRWEQTRYSAICGGQNL